jgi:hypothetical protein
MGAASTDRLLNIISVVSIFARLNLKNLVWFFMDSLLPQAVLPLLRHPSQCSVTVAN